MGRRCIVHERVHIGAFGDEEASGGIALGDYVTVEVGAVIEAGGTEIGTDSVIGVRSRIGHGAVIGKVGTTMPSITKSRLTVVELHDITPYDHQARRKDSRLYRGVREWPEADRQTRSCGFEA